MNHPFPRPFSLLLLCGAAAADGGSGAFYAGVNQANVGITGIPIHRGIETSASYNQQSVDSTGGYALESSAYLNKGLTNSKDSASARLAAYRLTTLSPNWLLRAGGQGDYYQNEDFPTDSYTSVGVEATLGHVDAAREGTDIFLSFRKEAHQQVDDDQYDMGRSTLRFTQYMPAGTAEAYWSWYGTYQQNNASDDNRDAVTTGGGVQYNQWELGTFKGQVGLHVSRDSYDGYRTASFFATGSLSKPLKKGLNLQFSANAGQYDAPVEAVDAVKSEDFYSVSTGLKWDF